MIGSIIYRFFLTAFLVGLAIAVYLAAEVAYLRPAGDIYRAACDPNCAPFRHGVIALTAAQVTVGAIIVLGLMSIVLAVVRRPKRNKSVEPTSEPSEDKDIELEEDAA